MGPDKMIRRSNKLSRKVGVIKRLWKIPPVGPVPRPGPKTVQIAGKKSNTRSIGEGSRDFLPIPRAYAVG